MPRISQYWADHLSDNDPKQYEKIAGRRIKEVAFRDEMVPYITLSSAIGGPLPIEYIIVGPDARKDLRADKLKKFLELSKLDIEVKISETPLV